MSDDDENFDDAHDQSLKEYVFEVNEGGSQKSLTQQRHFTPVVEIQKSCASSSHQ